MQYTQDYDETLPNVFIVDAGSDFPGGRWGGSTSNNVYWPQIVYPYHKSLQVFRCPSGVDVSTTQPTSGHYGANEEVLKDNGKAPLKIADMNAPANLYMTMDSGTYRIYFNDARDPRGNYSYTPGIGRVLKKGCAASDLRNSVAIPSVSCGDFTDGRHFDGVNVGFGDGHAKWLKTETVYAETQKGASGADGAWKTTGS